MRFGSVVLWLGVLLVAAPLASAQTEFQHAKAEKFRIRQAQKKKSRARTIDLRLARATERGDISEMRALLDRGADPDFNRTNTFRYPLLLLAAVKGQPAAVALLLDRGANPEARDLRGTPVLVSAASVAFSGPSSAPVIESIRILLDRGQARPNIRDTARIGDDRSALHMAAANGSRELVELLLDHGADPNQGNRFKETPLYFAAERGHLEVAKLLLARGANPNVRTRFTKMTPLLAAVQTGQSHMVRLLIEMRADLRVRDAFGDNPESMARIAASRAPTTVQKTRYRETLTILQSARQSAPRGSAG